MKQGEIVELFRILNNLGSQESPLKLTVAKNLQLLKPFVEDFTKRRDKKFQELAVVDENGYNVLTEEAKEVLKDKDVDPSRGLPLNFYVFEDEDGQEKLNEYITKMQEEEKDVEINTFPLSKKLKMKSGSDDIIEVTLEEYLESDVNKIRSADIAYLMDFGIIG